MWQILKSKLKNKLWMNLCILFGVILFIAVAVCHPLFLNGSCNRMLNSIFEDKITNENQYPTVVSRQGTRALKKGESFVSIMQKEKEYQKKWRQYFETDFVSVEEYYKIIGNSANTSYQGIKGSYNFGYMPELLKHCSIVKGQDYSSAKVEDGVIPCIISTRMMDANHLVLGETLTIDRFTDVEGKSVTFQIVGIYEEKEIHDCFWFDTTEQLQSMLMVDKSDFDSIAQEKEVLFTVHAMLDYQSIQSSKMDALTLAIQAFREVDDCFTCHFVSEMKSYYKQKKTLAVLLWVLEIPMIFLLLSFLIMVANNTVKSEQNEIAMLKSRGFSKWEIVRIYFCQFAFVAFWGLIIGLVVGFGLCKLAASTNSFLSFQWGDTSDYGLVWQMLLYAGGAYWVAVILLTIPSVLYSNQSIVERLSHDKRNQDSPAWQKYGLDLLFVGVSVYLLYNYNQQKDILASRVLNQKQLDPVIFVDSFLFLLGFGMLALRVASYIVKSIYKVCSKRLSPALFVSLLQITRTYKSQGFLSIFLVITIGCGLLNATLARTINQNGEERTKYNVGCDYKLEPVFPMSLVVREKQTLWYYKEPDYGKVSANLKQTCESFTRVIEDEDAMVSSNKGTIPDCHLYGIHTKEFGETATLKDGLNKEHWYVALNQLAEKTNGVIISRNLAKKGGYQVGDVITYSRKSPIKDTDSMGTINCEIVSIVDAWPGYDSYTYEDGKATPHYLLVCNYAFVVNGFAVTPYKYWVKSNTTTTRTSLLAGMKQAEVDLVQITCLQEEMQKRQKSALIQITNGMFTLSFLISLLLCFAGFFMYWIRSIRQRALLFGVYRAMGMKKKEISNMLFNEQLFSSVLAIASGMISGVLSGVLFVTLVATIYLPEKHCIPIMVYSAWQDMAKLILFLFFMCVICFLVMKKIVASMKLNECLKMGEDE